MFFASNFSSSRSFFSNGGTIICSVVLRAALVRDALHVALHCGGDSIFALNLLALELIVIYMLDTDGAAGGGGAIEVINGEDSGALVLVREEGKAARLAGGSVADEIDVDDLAELGEDGQHVALGKSEWKATSEDIRRVGVTGMPGGGRRGEALGVLSFTRSLCFAHLREGVHGGERRERRQRGV